MGLNRCSTRTGVDSDTVPTQQIAAGSICKHNEEAEDDEICPGKQVL